VILNTVLIPQTIADFAQNSTNNGILTFILGSLFVLSIYHFLLFFQHKDKSYLYYSVFTFLIFLAYIVKVENGFIKTTVDNLGLSGNYIAVFRWTYNCMYFLFAVEFLNLKTINKRWYGYIMYPIVLLFCLGIIAQLFKSVFNYTVFYNFFTEWYLTLISIQTLLSFWFIFKLKDILKYYIIVGAIILFISSIIGEHSIRTLSFIDISGEKGDFFFYVGVFIESVCFSLGLGHKQRRILHQRNKANTKLISKLKENEVLRGTVSEQFEERIGALNEQIKFKQEISDLRLKALRSQMNPHFIFNSLNSIKLYIINNEKENAVYYLNKFAKLIRKILEASMTSEISLEEELETAELYMNIENIRFSNEVNFNIEVDPELNTANIKVPSLVLQPFIENAIWHGLSSKDGEKKITITIKRVNDNYTRINIEDNGIGRKASKEINARKFTNQKSFGIDITRERLSDFSKSYSKDFNIAIKDILDKNKAIVGTRVVIDVPIKPI
jgi:sensor histidine kinase YesM